MSSPTAYARVWLLAAMLPLPLLGQVTATLSGTVRDQQGAAIPRAHIALINDATQLQREVFSSATGEYLLIDVAVGSYRLEIEAAGFRKFIQAGIVLSVNQSARNDVTLTLGSLTQEVTVQASARMIDANVSEVKYTVDSARMKEIPLAGRNVLALTAITPGVIATSMPNGVGGTQTGLQAKIYVNGNRYSNNNFQLDGADFNGTAMDNNPARYPSPDAVEEFTILTNALKAEFGQGAAVVNAVSRSGTNKYHLTTWEFLRNNQFNANNFFGGPTANKYQYNQFGAAGGGPVIRNKTFFFLTYEGLRGRLETLPPRPPFRPRRNAGETCPTLPSN